MAFPAIVAAVAGGVWYLWSNQGTGHGLTLEDKAFSPMSWEPYAWWSTHREEAHVRHFPQEMGPSCLPAPLSTQEGALSTSPRNNEESPYG
jgi:hypothetical protein